MILFISTSELAFANWGLKSLYSCTYIAYLFGKRLWQSIKVFNNRCFFQVHRTVRTLLVIVVVADVPSEQAFIDKI